MEEESYRAHVMVLPYHGQGHINPMLQFSKRLAANSIKVTVATTLSNSKAIDEASSIRFESIYDDSTHGGVAGSGGFKGFLDRFEAIGSTNLIQLITRSFQEKQQPVKCLIYDANIPWASRVAAHFGIAKASFFTQSCAFIASCYPMHCDLLGVSPALPPLPMPGLPPLRLPNLPSLGPQTGQRYPPIIRYILTQFGNTDKADWVLFNSFHELEEEAINWMSQLWPVRTIGPTLPSLYLDNRVTDDCDYAFNMMKPQTDACLKWLDSKEKESVIYVSFGSAASLSSEQTQQLAKALVNSGMSFLWVVKESSELVGESERGLVVKWCPQLAVLAHAATGCFVSHCGWNSTMEAISLGVPMVGMPQFLDQMSNAHMVEHIWRVGMKAKTDDMGVSGSEEIERCIQEVMRGCEVKKNASRWKALANEAISHGGTSDATIHQIIAHLCT